MNVHSLSENTLLILFDQEVSQKVFQQVRLKAKIIEQELAEYIIDMVPAYASIQLVIRLALISHSEFKQRLLQVIDNRTLASDLSSESRLISIPVYYGEEVALDMDEITAKTGLTRSEVISLHTATYYDVYAIGFAPGFAYLGNVHQRIASPRKQTPRKKITRGSVGIADLQTAVYPADSPGGWQIIGKTPMVMVDYQNPSLTPLAVGDQVKFEAISRDEFLVQGGQL